MPFRCRRRFSLLPGLHATLTPRGVSSIRAGGRHVGVTVSRLGAYASAALGGGLSYRTRPRRSGCGCGCLPWLVLIVVLLVLIGRAS